MLVINIKSLFVLPQKGLSRNLKKEVKTEIWNQIQMSNMCFMGTQWRQEKEGWDSTVCDREYELDPHQKHCEYTWYVLHVGPAEAAAGSLDLWFVFIGAARPGGTQLLGNDRKQNERRGGVWGGGESQMDRSDLLPNTSLLNITAARTNS